LADIRPYDRKRLIANAHRARNHGRDRQAIAIYRRILIEEPKNVEVALRAAPLLAYRGARFEAWQLFRNAFTELLRKRRIEAGLAAMREACRCVPNEYEAWRCRAQLELKLGREETAYQTLLEARQYFRTQETRAEAIALLTRARGIEPWDPDVCIDLARLYLRTDQVDVALELLASLIERVRGRELRRVRALQWRMTLSLRHGWLWLRALVGARSEPPPRSAFELSQPSAVTSLFPELSSTAAPKECIALERKLSA